MIINSENIIQALNKYFPKKHQELFENTIGQPITSFIKVFFNAICFDIDRFENLFKYNPNYYNISLNDWIKQEYGNEFYNLFKEELTSRPFNAIAVILD